MLLKLIGNAYVNETVRYFVIASKLMTDWYLLGEIN